MRVDLVQDCVSEVPAAPPLLWIPIPLQLALLSLGSWPSGEDVLGPSPREGALHLSIFLLLLLRVFGHCPICCLSLSLSLPLPPSFFLPPSLSSALPISLSLYHFYKV